MRMLLPAMTALMLLSVGARLTVAQSIPRSTPAAVGMSSQGLAGFASLATAHVESGQLAGVVTLVVRRGRLVHQGAYGGLDITGDRPMRPDAIFRIASMTKPITSVAVMMLVEEGKLLLSDPVSRYLPAFERTTVRVQEGDAVRQVAAHRPITIRDLLTHTSGIPYPDTDEPAAELLRKASLPSALLNYRDETMAVMVDRLAAIPLVAQPGARFVYGFNVDVLGVIVEKISGMTLDEFLRRRIFEPLGMRDTHFFLPPAKAGRLVAIHALHEGRGLVRGRDDDMDWTGQGAFASGPRRALSGGAGLLSTAGDYARFLQMLINGGSLDGRRLLSPSTVRLMTVNHVGKLYEVSEGRPGIGFGLGFEVKVDPARGGFDIPPAASPGAYAWGGAAYTTFWVDPEQGLIAIFMAQMRPYAQDDLSHRFGSIVYQAILDQVR